MNRLAVRGMVVRARAPVRDGVAPRTGAPARTFAKRYNRWMKSFNGKVALITGASSGIGAATALRLAGQGCAVTLAARNQDALDEIRRRCASSGGRAISVPTDVADAEQCRHAVEATV